MTITFGMDVAFRALILSKIRYAMFVWCGRKSIAAMQKNRLNALLSRMYKNQSKKTTTVYKAM